MIDYEPDGQVVEPRDHRCPRCHNATFYSYFRSVQCNNRKCRFIAFPLCICCQERLHSVNRSYCPSCKQQRLAYLVQRRQERSAGRQPSGYLHDVQQAAEAKQKYLAILNSILDTK